MPARPPRTPLAKALRASNAARTSMARSGVNTIGGGSRTGVTRREFLRMGALGAAALMLPGCSPSSQQTSSVIIVGAGLAGLRCAHLLHSNGIAATVHEASGQLGGRVSTLRGFFDQGQIAEHGGEFISTEHSTMRRLAGMFELDLERVDGEAGAQLEDLLWVDGSPYPMAAANQDWALAFESIQRALASAPWPQTHDSNTEEGRRLDHVSVPEWIDAEIAGGLSGRLGQIMYTTVTAEYGGEASDLPALALIYLLGWNGRDAIAPLAGTDEAFHIRGGNDQLVTRLYQELPSDTVVLGSVLEAVQAVGSGRYRCTFRRDGAVVDATADHLVLALPFTALRDVDLDGADLSDLKLRAIGRLGMGTSSKLHVQLSSRPWVARGQSGFVVTDPESFQMAWDETAADTSASSILVNFTGGSRSLRAPGALSAEAPADLVAELLEGVEPIFGGTSSQFNGRAWRDWWVASPWHHGSYSYWRLGQSTDFAGIEPVREGNIHFCGEHTSIEFGGYMEGAVRSGLRAAMEIISG